MGAAATPLGVVPVQRYDRAGVAADLRRAADEVDAGEHGDPGKFVLVLIRDGECAGAAPAEYDASVFRSRMYDREVMTALDYVKTFVSLRLWGAIVREVT